MTPEQIFARLAQVRSFSLLAESRGHSRSGWNHSGRGRVSVSENRGCLDFAEELVLDNGRLCRDQKRWYLDGRSLVFCRRRNGSYEPIFTFEPAASAGTALSAACYLCPPDRYGGSLSADADAVTLAVTVCGARKDERLVYRYSAEPDGADAPMPL